MISVVYTMFFVIYILTVYPYIYDRLDGIVAFFDAPPILGHASRDRVLKRYLLAFVFVLVPLVPRFIWPELHGYYYEGRLPEVNEDFGFFWPIHTLLRFFFGWLDNTRTSSGGHIDTAVDPEGLVG
ncbi:MAG: hypothetical protein STHCBS139747_002361 [Sporothrix thermara]